MLGALGPRPGEWSDTAGVPLMVIQLATRFAFQARPTRHLSVLQTYVHFALTQLSCTRSQTKAPQSPESVGTVLLFTA
jgi:hypothetical protein